MKEIKLTLTIDETNVILKSLQDQPFKEVVSVIGKIQTQANEQLQAKPEDETEKT